jgi:hypothetical protein
MRAADDFRSIRDRMDELRIRPPDADVGNLPCPEIDSATCPVPVAQRCRHKFSPATSRCVRCNLHYFHLPAVTKPSLAGSRGSE